MLEGPVGTIASAHVFSTFESLAFGTELFGPLLLTEDILKTPLNYQNFELETFQKDQVWGLSWMKTKIDNLRRQ